MELEQGMIQIQCCRGSQQQMIADSEKMYKDRIRKWGLDKKVKGHEMMAIIRKKAERSCIGKASAFRIREQDVPEKKIARYRKAKKLFSAENILRIRAPTPPGFECYTPMASPLTTPRELETSELIARLLQNWISGSFDRKSWLIEGRSVVMAKHSDRFTPAVNFHEWCINALSEFRYGESKEAWHILNIAMARIQQFIQLASPYTFNLLIDVVGQYIFYKLPNILSVLLIQVAAMSASLLPQSHPFNQIFARLLEQDPSQLRHIILVAIQSQIDCFVQRTGRFSEITVNVQLERWRLMADFGGVRSTESYSTQLAEIEHALGASHPLCLNVQLGIAQSSIRSREFRKAVKAAQSVIAPVTQTNSGGIASKAYYYLSLAHHGLLEIDLAEQSICRALRIRVNTFGWQDDRLLLYMNIYASWLKDWDRPKDAAKVRQQRQEIIDSKYNRLMKEEDKMYQRYLAAKGIQDEAPQ